LVDRFFKIPRFDSEDLLPTLLKICHAERVDIIIPIFEPELLILSENREFLQDVKILLPSKEAVRLCLDKEQTLHFFSRNDIPTCKVYNQEEIGCNIFPAFLKPKIGNSSRGTMVLHNRDELRTHYSPEKNLLCEFLQGEEFTIDIYCQKQGVITCLLARKRLEITDGMAVRAETYQDSRLSDYCEKIMALLEYEGVCCIQCIYDKDYRFFEINPRFGGSSNLTLEAGYNIPLYVLDDFYGHDIKLPNKVRDLYMVKYYENAYWDI